MAEREFLLKDDGATRVWRHGWGALAFGTLALCLVLAFALATPEMWPFAVGASFLYWRFVIRPRFELSNTELRVRGFRTRVVPLRQIVDAYSNYYGLSAAFEPEGLQSRNVGSVVLATSNWYRWRGLVSRGDKAAGLIKMRAEAARGNSLDSVLLKGQRGPGDWFVAVLVASQGGD